MNLRTFLPPARLPVAPVPAVGSPAPELPAETAGRPAVVAFLRHTGCPFAEATFLDMRRRAEGDAGLRWIAVSHATADATAAWCDSVAGGSGPVEVAVDPERRFYAAWGLGRTGAGHFLGHRSLAGVARLARRGIRNRHPEGTRWQTAGTFAIDASGTVRLAHVPRHAGDLPDLSAAARAARHDTDPDEGDPA